MMMLLSKILLTAALCGAVIEGEHTGDVRVVPVEATPEPSEVELLIAYPKEDEVEEENPVRLQFRLEAYPLGFFSDFTRAREVRDSEAGQALHIIIDGKPPISVNEAIDEISESEEINYDQTIITKVPYNLSKGMHVLRAFLVRSFDESLKGPKTFATSIFYVGHKDSSKTVDLSRPFLTYNQPQGTFNHKQPILLDFIVSNTQLSKDGYKVRLIIDGTDKRLLTEWNPHYIYGLNPGSHTIKIELLDPRGKVLPPLFDDLQQTIVVK